MLGSVCKAPKATDEMLAKELHDTHAKSKVLCRPKVRVAVSVVGVAKAHYYSTCYACLLCIYASVCKAPKATDEMLAKELHETHAKSKVLCRPKVRVVVSVVGVVGIVGVAC